MTQTASFTIPFLQPGISHNIVIRAVNSEGGGLTAGTISGTLRGGGGVADPYIYPILSNVPVKLPDLDASYRLYEFKNTFVNAEVLKATVEHTKRMKQYLEKMHSDDLIKHCITDGYFFSKFFIQEGKNKIMIDLRQKNMVVDSDETNFFNITSSNSFEGFGYWSGTCKKIKIKWTNNEKKIICVNVFFFDNPHIENGIDMQIEDLNPEAIGLCVRNYKPKLMRLKTVDQNKFKKLYNKLKKSKHKYQTKNIKTQHERWFIKN